MKKNLLLLSSIVTGFFAFAQHPDLLNTNWKIVKIVNEIGPVLYPPSLPMEQVSNFSDNPAEMSILFFNLVSGDLTYSGNDVFFLQNKNCTTADYWGDNGEVNAFFGALCAFFENESNFYYTILNSENEKTLVIGNSIFGAIYFVSAELDTKDRELFSPVLAPNPVKNFLTVQNSMEIESVKIFGMSGKTVYERKNENRNVLNINLQNLQSGIYFIQINNGKTYKFIKE